MMFTSRQGQGRRSFPRLRQRKFELQNLAMGARELQTRVVNNENPQLESFRAWESQANRALEEIEEIEAVLEIVDRLTQNGDGLWKSRYLWIFVLFSLLQIIPLTIYILR